MAGWVRPWAPVGVSLGGTPLGSTVSPENDNKCEKPRAAHFQIVSPLFYLAVEVIGKE